MTFSSLIQILQTAISPVALISGVGLLVLAMTNRFAHTTDRTRQLAKSLKTSDGEEKNHLEVQIAILYRRLRIQLLAISFSLASVFCAALLVITLFAAFILDKPLQLVAAFLFIAGMLWLVLSVTLFIYDMTLSLRALKDELRDVV